MPATSIPLAFAALAVASGTFGAVELGLLASDQSQVAALVALLLTAPLQLLACVIGFWRHDPVAGTGTGVQAGTWAVTGLVTLLAPPGTRTPGLGIFLLWAALAMIVPVLAGRRRWLEATVMATSGLRFGLTGLSQLIPDPRWRFAAGVLGVLLAIGALTAALVLELQGAEQEQAD